MLPRALALTLLLLPALAGAQASYSTADRDRMIIGAATAEVSRLGPNPYPMYTSAWSHEEDRRVAIYEAAMRRESDRIFKQQTDAALAADRQSKEDWKRRHPVNPTRENYRP